MGKELRQDNETRGKGEKEKRSGGENDLRALFPCPLVSPSPCLPIPHSLLMPYELFIALRYLRAKRRQAAVSVITAIAVAGITVGVAALIVAQALITGFTADVQNKILQGTAHLNLLREDNSGIENYRELVDRMRQTPGVR